MDLIAQRGSDRIAIQDKRYRGNVSHRAVSDAMAEMQHYGCNRAVVITNNRFSPGAVALARPTGCELVDCDRLAQWIMEVQQRS